VSSLAGKVACITGAARGQGRSHAVALAAEGVAIIGVDSCSQVETAPYPMATEDDLAQTVAEVESVGGRISTPAPTLTMDEQVWQDTIDINLTGVWKTCRATVPHIIEGGRGGSVIITSSAATEMVSANIAHYSATKAGLVGLMRVLAKELAPHGIRVNTIHPSGVKTPMILNEPMYRLFRPDLPDPSREDFEESARSHNAMGVFALDPEDVSAAVLYLASDSGRYITGATHYIDAGGQLL
jgi:(+)-trans-carveol dehydrogenase